MVDGENDFQNLYIPICDFYKNNLFLFCYLIFGRILHRINHSFNHSFKKAPTIIQVLFDLFPLKTVKIFNIIILLLLKV